MRYLVAIAIGLCHGSLLSFLLLPSDSVSDTEHQRVLRQMSLLARQSSDYKAELAAREEDLDELVLVIETERSRNNNTLSNLIAERDLAVSLLKSFGTTPIKPIEPTTTTRP